MTGIIIGQNKGAAFRQVNDITGSAAAGGIELGVPSVRGTEQPITVTIAAGLVGLRTCARRQAQQQSEQGEAGEPAGAAERSVDEEFCFHGGCGFVWFALFCFVLLVDC